MHLMLGPGAIRLFSFPPRPQQRKRRKCHLRICTSNRNPDPFLPSPRKEKNYFAHNLYELDECSCSIQSTQTAQALGKLLIFYWWPRLSKHNKNRPGVIACWKSRWQSEAKLHPAVCNFKLHQFGALLLLQARFPLKWRRQGRRTLYSWAGWQWLLTSVISLMPGDLRDGKEMGYFLSQVPEYNPGEWKTREVLGSLRSHQPRPCGLGHLVSRL